MKNGGKMHSTAKKFIAIIIFLALSISSALPISCADAAGNLLAGGDFEGGVEPLWDTWQAEGSARVYDVYRAEDAPFGYGSFSMAIDTDDSAPEDRFASGIAGNNASNRFRLATGKKYYLTFYAKSNRPASVTMFLEEAATYKSIPSTINTVLINDADWQRYLAILEPVSGADVMLAMVYGDLPANTSIRIDGMRLTEANTRLSTNEVKGYIGDKNKILNLNDISFLQPADIEIELPFYDADTAEAGLKRFNPKKITSSQAYFDMPYQTYSGIGKVYIFGAQAGQFNYIVNPRISSIYPALLRCSEDLTVYGTGFSPVEGQTYLVFKVADIKGKKYEYWAKPRAIDSKLTQFTVEIPVGVISDNLYALNAVKGDSKDILLKSNSISYKVKPSIFAINWSKKGFYQVGDKVTIYGKGISNSPKINFYDANLKKVEKKTAKVLAIGDTQEIIEVETNRNYNKLSITVEVDGIESDMEKALSYSATSKLKSIASRNKRSIDSATYVQAAKVGEEITLNGEGFSASSDGLIVEFQGAGRKIQASPASFDKSGKWVKVKVPAGALSGEVSILANGSRSNSLPLEIIPAVISINPDPVEPGKIMTLKAYGVGSSVSKTKVIIGSKGDEQQILQPDSIAAGEQYSTITVKAPKAISSKYNTIDVQYGYWKSDGNVTMTARPQIDKANIDMDTKILSIKGHGFSPNIKENIITYRYADADKTVIQPKVSIVGIYNDEEGQEIRVKILDNYHYGYLTVTVGGVESNEANFGPVYVNKITRRIEYVKSEGRTMGVLYISGNNLGKNGGVKVGDHWANVHYRRDFSIIAVIDQQYLYDNPVVVAKQ